MQFRHLTHERNDISQEFHQSPYSHILTCAHAKDGKYRARHKSFTDSFTHFVFCQSLFFKKLLHQTLIVFGRSLHEFLMKFHRLLHFFGRNILNNGFTTIGFPRIFFHQEDVYQSIKSGPGLQRILHQYTLRTVYVLHHRNDIIEVTLLGIKLIDQENDRFFQLFSVSEDILCAHFGSVLTVNQNHGFIRYVERSDCSADEIIRSGTINDVKLFVVPFYVENGWEHRVSVFLLHGEIITHCILRFY